MVKVRFAPSPTGVLHVGGIRTALFNYFYAKSHNGSFFLRNEDTDQSRKVEDSLGITENSLRWLGVKWDGFVTQSERLSEYKKYADILKEKGFAYDDGGAIRFKIDKSIGEVFWTDAIGEKVINYKCDNLEDFIILKADGFPTYHLANVIDDHLMEITHVIRGEDWIPSAPKHLLLYKAFGWDAPVFAHVPNVLGTDGKKLSKRRGAKSVLDFKNEGILTEALLNYLMLLGWSPKNDVEIISRDTFEKDFKLENVNSSPSIFDEKKLSWMNAEYIRAISTIELAHRIREFNNPFVEKIPEKVFMEFVGISQTRMKYLSDFETLVSPFIVKNSDHKDINAQILYEKLSKIENWNSEIILENIKSFLEENNLRFPDLYLIVIGQKQGLPLAEAFEILGKDKTLKMLK